MDEKDLLPEEANILTLTGENGEEVDFELLAVIEHEEKEYAVVLPVEDDSGEVVILQIESVDEDTDSFLAVDDDAVLEAVYAAFKELYKDILNFED
jgi:uncharacterized protein YrzB (UPF0473 family)